MMRNFRNAIITILSMMVAMTMPSAASAEGPIRGFLKEKIQERRGERQSKREQRKTQDLSIQEIRIDHGGRTRSFFLHVPDGYREAGGRSAVITFHGGMGSGLDIAKMSRMTKYADAYNFLAVYPNAGGRQWNDGRQTTNDGINDVGFARAIVSYLRQNYGVSRVFASGASNGGMMVQRLACEANSDFTSFAVVIANLPRSLYSTCNPKGPVDMVFFYGTADPLMPFGGGTIKSSRSAGAGGQVLSVDETLSFWTSRSGCTQQSKQALADRIQDGTKVSRLDYGGCTSAMSAYLIEGGGHTWPGSGMENRVVGNVSSEIDASQIIVDFFRRDGL